MLTYTGTHATSAARSPRRAPRSSRIARWPAPVRRHQPLGRGTSAAAALARYGQPRRRRILARLLAMLQGQPGLTLGAALALVSRA